MGHGESLPKRMGLNLKRIASNPAIGGTGKTLKLGPSVPKLASFLSRLRLSVREDQNRRITHIGLGTPAVRLLRQYWQPARLPFWAGTVVTIVVTRS